MLQKNHNLSLPSWAIGKVSARMTQVSGQQFAFESWTPELKHFRIGPLVKELMNTMENAVNGSKSESEQTEKMVMYSAHDSTLAGVLNAFGVYDLIPPHYAAALILELHKDPNYEDFHVNVRNSQQYLSQFVFQLKLIDN
jgi:hypothetical protein